MKQPWSPEAERRVLGGLIHEAERVGYTFEELAPTDFYWQDHRRIFEAALGRHRTNKVLDFASLSQCFAEPDIRNTIGELPPFAHQKHDEIVRELRMFAVARAVITTAMRIVQIGHEADVTPERLIDAADDMAAVSVQRTDAVKFETLEQLAGQLILETAASRRGLATGVEALDRLLRDNGLGRNRLYVLGGRPGSGKSALAAQIAHYIASSRPVLFISLEMHGCEILERLVQAHTYTAAAKTAQHKVDLIASVACQTPKLHIASLSRLTVAALRSACLQASMREPIDLVVVDYLQLVDATSKDDPRFRVATVSTITRGLKQLAMELQAPVLALSQLNRESDEFEPPKLSHLRESGTIEQDADCVLLLHRNDRETDRVHLRVAKQRNGSTGLVRLEFRRAFTRFEPWDGTPDAAPNAARTHRQAWRDHNG